MPKASCSTKKRPRLPEITHIGQPKRKQIKLLQNAYEKMKDTTDPHVWLNNGFNITNSAADERIVKSLLSIAVECKEVAVSHPSEVRIFREQRRIEEQLRKQIEYSRNEMSRVKELSLQIVICFRPSQMVPFLRAASSALKERECIKGRTNNCVCQLLVRIYEPETKKSGFVGREFLLPHENTFNTGQKMCLLCNIANTTYTVQRYEFDGEEPRVLLQDHGYVIDDDSGDSYSSAHCIQVAAGNRFNGLVKPMLMFSANNYVLSTDKETGLPCYAEVMTHFCDGPVR